MKELLIEDKSNPEKNLSHEFKSSEIFQSFGFNGGLISHN